ncbi:hypothetical protein CI1B_53870 [Bradyrhizobium ivorense]|uniref:Uncharacterized protein n=1 Tax=Bradyrhizobium ivorense TaxID=2511166 RepID=A0A508TJT5_9BRAD|nr:hypothetical protein [Bradyrhizobium ivorense]VIO74613.1 hypothetical protein CI1B_53870 [Bradyrhizobium ivorense]
MSDDPTDNALAAIASILDQPTAPPEPAKTTDKATDKTADKPAAPAEEPPVAVAVPPPLPQSIEQPLIEQPSIEPGPSEAEPSQPEASEPEQSEPEPSPQPVQPIEANGYSKAGPGPMAALRFRWTVREDGGRYYVDETVGEGSTPLVNGPMDKDAAIKFVDDREAEARQRFEDFRQEMITRTVPAAPTVLAHEDNGDDEARE